MQDDEAAASEIVGVLMLIVIVVAASASFATFALDKQDQIQEQKRFEHLKGSEEFAFGDIDLAGDGSVGWDEITVTVQPLHIRESLITGAKLDGDPLREFTIERHTQPAPNKYRIVAHDDALPYTYAAPYVDPVLEGLSTGPLDRLTIPAREPFKITINLRSTGLPQGGGANEPYDPADDTEDFFSATTPVVLDSKAFRVSFTTGFLNQPEQAFTPPDIAVTPRLDCAYDLLTFEVKDVRVHQEGDYALDLAWTVTNLDTVTTLGTGSGYQMYVSIAAETNGDQIEGEVVVELSSGLRSAKAVVVTLPTGCI